MIHVRTGASQNHSLSGAAMHGKEISIDGAWEARSGHWNETPALVNMLTQARQIYLASMHA